MPINDMTQYVDRGFDHGAITLPSNPIVRSREKS